MLKTGLRYKITIISIIFISFISLIIGFSFYIVSINYFYNNFIKNNLVIVKTIARTINGDIHSSFDSYESVKDNNYQDYLKKFNEIKKDEDFITYLYSLVYKNNNLYYGVDADIFPYDILWVETDFFALKVFHNEKGILNVEYDQNIYNDNFRIKSDYKLFNIYIKTENNKNSLWLEDKKLFTIESIKPLVIQIENMTVDKNNRISKNKIDLNNKQIIFDYSFTGSGESQSDPGVPFIDNTKTLDKIKKIIINAKDYVNPEPYESIYGKTLSFYGIIKNRNNVPVGAVVADVSTKDIIQFNNKIKFVAILLSIIAFILTFIFSIILSQYLLIPVKKLSAGVSQITKGNLETFILIKRKDEFGELANGFNKMTSNLLISLSDSKKAQEKLIYLAYYDELTGLLNRKSFYDKLNETLSQSERVKDNNPTGLLLIVLDQYKTINDTFGRQIGDMVIKHASERIRQTVRKTDFVFRLGNVEFSIILNHLKNESDAVLSADKIIRLLTSPFYLEKNTIFIHAVIGICIYPKDGNNVETLIKNCDAALFEAKNQMISYKYYTEDMQSKAINRMKIISGLHEAIENNNFSLYYQPQVDSKNKLKGVEALIRWKHPELGNISPQKFIPIAEDIGLILKIGKWVLNTACRDRKQWEKIGLTDIPVSINLSVKQLKNKDLDDEINFALDNNNLVPDNINFEITESFFMDNIEENIKKITELRKKGFKFSIDDFGTGYSSLSYLKRLPIDMIKIDKSFISGIPESSEDKALVKTIIVMAKELNFEIVAEGVESEEQVKFLKSHKCNFYQGHLFSKALPNEMFMEFLKKY